MRIRKPKAMARALGNVSNLGAVALHEGDLDAAQASWEEGRLTGP